MTAKKKSVKNTINKSTNTENKEILVDVGGDKMVPLPIRKWVGDKCTRTITIKDRLNSNVVCHVGKFTEIHNPGVEFDPIICSRCCFDDIKHTGETVTLKAVIDGIDCKVKVGADWYNHEFFRFCVAPESDENKCMCRCIHNFVDLKNNCPQCRKNNNVNDNVQITIEIDGKKQKFVGKIVKK